MLTVKLYKYDSSQAENGYRGEDFSSHILQGSQFTEDVTQELDTTELTISGISRKDAFDPESKFIADIIDGEEVQQTVHLCVLEDMVVQPILSDDEYFDHHISFIEPSVVAQKRLVDNVSVTYKLKDVTLDEQDTYPTDNVSVSFETPSAILPSGKVFGIEETSGRGYTQYTARIGKLFIVRGSMKIVAPDGEEYSNIYENISRFDDGDGNYLARFRIPQVEVMIGIFGGRNFQYGGYVSLDYKIEEFAPNEYLNPSNTWQGSIITNTNFGTAQNVFGLGDRYNGEWLLEHVEGRTVGATSTVVQEPIAYYKRYSDRSVTSVSYLTQQISIKTDKRYVVTISLHQFSDNLSMPSGAPIGGRLEKFVGEQPICYNQVAEQVITGGSLLFISENKRPMTTLNTSASPYFLTYSIDTGKIVYSSSVPYSAMSLLQKAIINSSLYEKKADVYVGDVNNSDLPFYIDDEYADRLRAARIIENFYNQKNLWEIMVEVGNYIHAIPEVKFGENDKFLITFNDLGRTDQKENKNNTVSIFNSRSVEDYISSCSSYITNMVQLGGFIEEWVAPKTTNDELLIYNDTAEILTSKPIIELLEIKVKDITTGDIADMTQFIYEKNVYDTLSIDYAVYPNRGVAMYYELGTNAIKGGQYQLPRPVTDRYSDYTFKKIIWCAYNGYSASTGSWSNIQINNYVFLVKYRTKDSVRQNHTRPDLRKYLVNSIFDKFPEHNQFNNQTDVVVDSIKFGNNMYGKLIKTGNNSYKKTEWSNNYSEVKHKGELYKINGELYYVAKVTHYIFSSYILSEVSFSKDYNELSQVIGIPSEPRFYEISEQSLIWRELAINDFLLLTDDEEKLNYDTNYVFDLDHLGDLILGTGTDFAKYAVTVFKGDKDVPQYEQAIGEKNSYIEVINPINAYSSENTLTYEWDMADNYSAGDKVTDAESGVIKGVANTAYSSLWAVRYTDIYGKAALMDFYILGGIGTPTASQIRNFPESPINTKYGSNDARPFIDEYDILATNVKYLDTDYNGRGLALLKDCREAISINYNLQLITSSDTFVTSPFVFSPNKQNLYVVLLNEEVNKLSAGYIDNSKIITPISTSGVTMDNRFPINSQAVTKYTTENTWDTTQEVVSHFSLNLSTMLENVSTNHFIDNENYQRVKAIAVVCDVSDNAGESEEASTIPYKTKFVFARNIPSDWTKAQAIKDLFIGSPDITKVFTNRQ